MCINVLLISVASFLLGIALLYLLSRLSTKYKLLIRNNISLIGGLSLAVAFFIAGIFGIFLFRLLSFEMSAIMGTAGLMFIFGLLDDWKELSVSAKFFVQIISSLLLFFFGIRTNIIYLGGFFNLMITLIWVLAITNAFNHLDIMDGQAAVAAVMISGAFLIISFSHLDLKTVVLCSALIGSVLSFLTFNFPPARLYMGNSGSHFLGFILAAVAMLISYAPRERKIALFSPLLILGFPIFDTAFLVLMRIGKKKLPFKKSNDHIALRLLALGFTQRETLGIIVLWNALFISSGIIVSRASTLLGIITIGFVILLNFFLALRVSKVTAA